MKHCPAELLCPYGSTCGCNPREVRPAHLTPVLVTDLSDYPPRIMLGTDPVPTCWSADSPLRYDYPHTD